MAIGAWVYAIAQIAPSIARALSGGGSLADKALRVLSEGLGPQTLEELQTTERIELAKIRGSLQLAEMQFQALMTEAEMDFITKQIEFSHRLAMKQLDYEKVAVKDKRSFFFTGARYIAMWMSVTGLLLILGYAALPVLAFFVSFETLDLIITLANKTNAIEILAWMGTMLGLGGYGFRTIEKFKDKERNSFEE